MEKVPSLDIFSSRHLKKSSSLSRINHDSTSRPSSALQPQRGTPSHAQKNYYGKAIGMLNLDSRITTNLRNISNRQEEIPQKGNLKKVTKNYQIEKQHVIFASQNPQVVPQFAPMEVPQAQTHQHAVKFAYPPLVHHRNVENIHPQQVIFHQNPPNFMSQAAPKVVTQQSWFPPPHQQTHIGMHIPQPQQIPFNNLHPHPHPHPHPHSHLQRANSVQNLHQRDYSQPDRIITTATNIPPASNNNEQQLKLKRPNSKRQQYTFRKQESVQSSGKFITTKPVTLNPFLFDATYLLQIKQSQARLPDMALMINTKECYEQMQKKRDLIEELIEIKEANQVQAQNILRQLDSLIEQFDTKPAAPKIALEESQFRSSRRSMFSRGP